MTQVKAVLLAALIVSAPLVTSSVLAQTTTQAPQTEAAVPQLGEPGWVASDGVKALTDIVLKTHMENLIRENYQGAAEVYFSQTAYNPNLVQLQDMFAAVDHMIGETYDLVMPNVHQVIAVYFSPEEAEELASLIGSVGVSGAVENELGQRFAQIMPILRASLDGPVYEAVYANVSSYRQAVIDAGIALGHLQPLEGGGATPQGPDAPAEPTAQ